MKTMPTLFFVLLCLFPEQVFAMHIAEGILPVKWSALWWAVSLPFLALGIRSLNIRTREDLSAKPLAGLVAAVVFVISCMPIPIPMAGTCSHPCGTGIAAILLGPSAAVVSAAVALMIQALLLAHGGVTTWGGNLFAMGIAGGWSSYIVWKMMKTIRAGNGLSAFAAGLASDWATYLATAAILSLGIRGDDDFLPLFMKVAIAFVPTQLPLGLLEGAATSGMIILLSKKRPDLIERIGGRE